MVFENLKNISCGFVDEFKSNKDDRESTFPQWPEMMTIFFLAQLHGIENEIYFLQI